MPTGARKVAQAALTAVITASITAAGFTSAFAAPAGCGDIDSATDSKAVQCIAALRLRAESAARTATAADEAYNQARLDAASTQQTADALRDAADRAEAVAERSRTRAAVITAQLAHGGGSIGQTTQVLLSGEDADRMLYHLSRMSELTKDTTKLSDAAVRDSRAAETLQTQAGLAADRAATSALHAKDAFAKAKRTAQTAIALVQRTEDRRDADAEKKAASKRHGTSSALQSAFVDLPADASVAATVLAFARAQTGDPYVFGAAGPGSWDCSGLTMMAFQAAGIGIGGHGATVQYTTAASEGLLVPYSQAQPGDLVFYGSGGDMEHVAVYSGGGNMIEAPHPGASVREVPVRPDGLAPMVARFTG